MSTAPGATTTLKPIQNQNGAMQLWSTQHEETLPLNLKVENLSSADAADRAATITTWMSDHRPIFDKITHIYLTNCNISVVPREMNRLPHLIYLNLWKNLIPSLPVEFTSLSNLKELNLSNNRITSIEAARNLPASLTFLDLKGNLLSDLPENSISSTPETILWPQTLTFLNLNGNGISSISGRILWPIPMERLYLKGNPIPSLPSQLTQRNFDIVWNSPQNDDSCSIN